MDKTDDYIKKEAHIIQRLSSSKIDAAYRPIITDIILRRCYEYNLNDEHFERDVHTFIKNVKKIEIGTLTTETEGAAAEFNVKKKKITISSQSFEEKNIDYEKLYGIVTHECMHAMNYDESKKDRTFNDEVGIMEAFTECEADEIVHNSPLKITEEGKILLNGTYGYGDITKFIDVISATFGVERRELLSAAIKGKEEFDNLFDIYPENILGYNMDIESRKIKQNIFLNIDLIHAAAYYSEISELNQENIEEAYEQICKWSETGIDYRISNLEVDNIEEFEKKFERIKLDQGILGMIIKGVSSKEEISEGKTEKQELVNYKLLYIQEILENENVKNKIELIQSLQGLKSVEEINELMESRGAGIDLREKRLRIKKDTIREYNEKNYSMEWNNDKIVEYIKEHQQEMQSTKPNILQALKGGVKNIFGKNNDEIKMLPETTEPKPWDLSNWGIDKEEFMQEQAEHIEEYLSRQEEQPTHSEHEESYEIE